MASRNAYQVNEHVWVTNPIRSKGLPILLFTNKHGNSFNRNFYALLSANLNLRGVTCHIVCLKLTVEENIKHLGTLHKILC